MRVRHASICEQNAHGEDDDGEGESEEHENAVASESEFGKAAQTSGMGEDVTEGGNEGPGQNC